MRKWLGLERESKQALATALQLDPNAFDALR
jgi:hypothetical protein